MKLLVVLNICLMTISSAFAQVSVDHPKLAFLLEINGVIGPATGDYFERSLDKANRANTEFILLKMDTPGGLDVSMRAMIKKIIALLLPMSPRAVHVLLARVLIFSMPAISRPWRQRLI